MFKKNDSRREFQSFLLTTRQKLYTEYFLFHNIYINDKYLLICFFVIYLIKACLTFDQDFVKVNKGRHKYHVWGKSTHYKHKLVIMLDPLAEF